MTAVHEDTGELLGLSDERDAQLELRQRAWREGWDAGYTDGYDAGHQDEAAARDRDWRRIARPIARGGPSAAALEAKRWGSNGRAHFADHLPGDSTAAEVLAVARASWEPFGLPPAGMVHVGGPAVHFHYPCSQACYAYKPGWYTPDAAAAILTTLPGDYAGAIEALREVAA